MRLAPGLALSLWEPGLQFWLQLAGAVAGPAASAWAFVTSRLSGWQLDGSPVSGRCVDWLHPTLLYEC